MSNYPVNVPDRPLSIPTAYNYRYRRSGNVDPNAVLVETQDISVYYSYRTVVAVRTLETGLCVCENVWSKTTGSHLNAINEDKRRRLTFDEFDRLIKAITQLQITEPTAPVDGKRRNLVRD